MLEDYKITVLINHDELQENKDAGNRIEKGGGEMLNRC